MQSSKTSAEMQLSLQVLNQKNHLQMQQSLQDVNQHCKASSSKNHLQMQQTLMANKPPTHQSKGQRNMVQASKYNKVTKIQISPPDMPRSSKIQQCLQESPPKIEKSPKHPPRASAPQSNLQNRQVLQKLSSKSLQTKPSLQNKPQRTLYTSSQRKFSKAMFKPQQQSSKPKQQTSLFYSQALAHLYKRVQGLANFFTKLRTCLFLNEDRNRLFIQSLRDNRLAQQRRKGLGLGVGQGFTWNRASISKGVGLEDGIGLAQCRRKGIRMGLGVKDYVRVWASVKGQHYVQERVKCVALGSRRGQEGSVRDWERFARDIIRKRGQHQ